MPGPCPPASACSTHCTTPVPPLHRHRTLPGTAAGLAAPPAALLVRSRRHTPGRRLETPSRVAGRAGGSACRWPTRGSTAGRDRGNQSCQPATGGRHPQLAVPSTHPHPTQPPTHTPQEQPQLACKHAPTPANTQQYISCSYKPSPIHRGMHVLESILIHVRIRPPTCGISGEVQARKSSSQEAAGVASQEAQGAREAADTCIGTKGWGGARGGAGGQLVGSQEGQGAREAAATCVALMQQRQQNGAGKGWRAERACASPRGPGCLLADLLLHPRTALVRYARCTMPHAARPPLSCSQPRTHPLGPHTHPVQKRVAVAAGHGAHAPDVGCALADVQALHHKHHGRSHPENQ